MHFFFYNFQVEADIAALARRIMLMEEETTKAEANLFFNFNFNLNFFYYCSILFLSGEPGQHCDQAGPLLQERRRRDEEGEGGGEQVLEQRGHPVYLHHISIFYVHSPHFYDEF